MGAGLVGEQPIPREPRTRAVPAAHRLFGLAGRRLLRVGNDRWASRTLARNGVRGDHYAAGSVRLRASPNGGGPDRPKFMLSASQLVSRNWYSRPPRGTPMLMNRCQRTALRVASAKAVFRPAFVLFALVLPVAVGFQQRASSPQPV